MRTLIFVYVLMLFATGGRSAPLSVADVLSIKNDVALPSSKSLETFATAVSTRTLMSLKQALAGGLGESGFVLGRHMLQSSGTCEWDKEAGSCDVSDAMGESLLSESSSPVAKILLEQLTCSDQTDSKSCMKSGCIWSDDECTVENDPFSGEAFQECLGDAAIFFQVANLGEQCALGFPTNESCSLSDECKWEEGVCAPDTFSLIFGSSFKRVNEVVQLFTTVWTRAILTQINLLLGENVDDVLIWEPPAVECPVGIDQAVCDFVEPTKELFTTTIYCRRKYSVNNGNLKECGSDALCAENKAQKKCLVSESVEDEVKQKQFDDILATLESESVRDILEPFVTCSSKTKAGCKDKCGWNALSQTCEPDNEMLMGKLGKMALMESGLPVCTLIGVALESGCINSPENVCVENDMCDWEEGDCGPGSKLFEAAVGRDDPKSAKKLKKLRKKCKKASSKDACKKV